MASICNRSYSPPFPLHANPVSLRFSVSCSLLSLSVSTPLCPVHFPSLRASASDQGVGGDSCEPALLQKPSISLSGGISRVSDVAGESVADNNRREVKWVDWEDQILEDTVPLVGFVRTILHSRKYENGDRLSPEHEKTVLEKLLPYHPDFEEKIGCGIDFITVGHHPDFENSRCLFIVRKDGVAIDFSYWKCIKGLIRKNYPLYADSFILRHFRQRQRKQR